MFPIFSYKVLSIKFQIFISCCMSISSIIICNGQICAEEMGMIDCTRYQVGSIKFFHQFLWHRLIFFVEIDSLFFLHINCK